MRINKRLMTHSKQYQLKQAIEGLLLIQDTFISIGNLLCESLKDSTIFKDDDLYKGNEIKTCSFESWSETK